MDYSQPDHVALLVCIALGATIPLFRISGQEMGKNWRKKSILFCTLPQGGTTLARLLVMTLRNQRNVILK